ncbi:Glycogenin-1 [Hypsibius exemplaris]|uniref:glycogenin glucosyltransferase n=1 Tax=Hypsibius exemplaris TaxID=2072580 RepID=A0A1W0W8W4_HYPEX|nr:Glycogenin-1 [Hypsibius exemplaris]
MFGCCGGGKRKDGEKRSCWADTRGKKGGALNITDLRRGSCDPNGQFDVDNLEEQVEAIETRLDGPTHPCRGRQAYVTLATNDTYGLGCLVLGESLRRVGTTKELVVMVTRHVSDAMRHSLEKTFDHVKLFDLLDSNDAGNLALLQRPELGVTLTKIHCWTLTEYRRAVFLDADTMVVRNCDELFDQYQEFSAAPDVGWPDCFNSGVFVYKPSLATYRSILAFAVKNGSFDGGDQGLLNMYFSDWARGSIKKHLPFIYNMVASIVYTYQPAFRLNADQVKIIHFLGPVKPWHWQYDIQGRCLMSDTGSLGDAGDLLTLWWNILISRAMPNIEAGVTGLAGEIHEKYKDCEEPYVLDYRGVDAYQNIQDHVKSKIPGVFQRKQK